MDAAQNTLRAQFEQTKKDCEGFALSMESNFEKESVLGLDTAHATLTEALCIQECMNFSKADVSKTASHQTVMKTIKKKSEAQGSWSLVHKEVASSLVIPQQSLSNPLVNFIVRSCVP